MSSAGTTAAVELRDVVKRYGDFTAVCGLNLTVPRGTTYGLLGPNGAGKTTTIRMILRIIRETEGEVRVLGRAVDQRVLERVGYLPEERGLYRRMRVLRLLEFLAELKGVPSSVARPRARAWLERLALGDWEGARVQELSKGMQQKLQFIGAVLHDPELVILDEPFSGLDPINQTVLREVVAELRRQGRTVLFSTHIIEHAERMCDHVGIIARGRLAVHGAVGEVKRRHGGRWVALDVAEGEAASVLRDSRLVAHVRGHGAEAEAALAEGADPQALLAELVRDGVRVKRFEVVEPSLEQVFIDTVGGSIAELEAEHAVREVREEPEVARA